MYKLDQVPFFARLTDSQNILLAGAGGGFDIYSGIPLYHRLSEMGKQVILANYSFTDLASTTAQEVYPNCYHIRLRDADRSGRNYFPEKHLCTFFALQGKQITLYGLRRIGVQPLLKAYKYLIKTHNIDTLILMDGGTDSLMFGDEDGLGTPEEDIASMAAAHRTGIKNQLLVSIGFGIDHFHGVSHYRFLENVSELMKIGGYLGVFPLLPEMEEAQLFQALVEYANGAMKGHESIVSNSIVSAIQGDFGDIHKTARTAGSELWINPLMSMYWAFDLSKLIRKIKYYDHIKSSHTIYDIRHGISTYRSELESLREKKNLPL